MRELRQMAHVSAPMLSQLHIVTALHFFTSKHAHCFSSLAVLPPEGAGGSAEGVDDLVSSDMMCVVYGVTNSELCE